MTSHDRDDDLVGDATAPVRVARQELQVAGRADEPGVALHAWVEATRAVARHPEREDHDRREVDAESAERSLRWPWSARDHQEYLIAGASERADVEHLSDRDLRGRDEDEA